MIKFSVPLEPVPWPRPRFNSKSKAVYNPPEYTAFKSSLGLFARQAMNGQAPFKGAIKLTADFYRNREPTAQIYGDADRHLSSVMDALQGICYDNDAQIVDVNAKLFRGEPHIIIELEELT